MSSTKIGDRPLLGAAGAVEAIFSLLAIRDGVIPPTLNLDNPSVDTPINLVPHQAQEKKVTAALSNSFGFGGTNASLVFVLVDWSVMQKLTALLHKFRIWLAAAVAAAVIAAAVPAGLVFMGGPHVETKRVLLPRGASLRTIAGRLQEAGAIRNALLFQAFSVRLRGPGPLRAGEV